MPSSSLFLRSSTTLISALSLLSASVSAAPANTYYALDTEYSGTSFFDGFNFQNTADYSHGFVTYGDRSFSESNGLISYDGGSVQMRVDSTHTYDGNADYYLINGVGRPSVRIQSAKSWTHGLFIADIKHIPTTTTTGGCSVWPAYWTLGNGEWPYTGEIDIIEGANNQVVNLGSAHTGYQCTIQQSPSQMTGTPGGNNCDYFLGNNQYNGVGCGAYDTRSTSWGAGFNSIGGGVYATEWTSDAISIWFFPRGSIPSDITAGTPDPSGWGLPFTIFNGPSCNIDANFVDHSIVFDTTFCGDWAGATWNSSGCGASYGGSCSVFVGDNPSQFVDAYWDINYVKVFKTQAVTTSTTSSTTSTTSTTTSATSTISTTTTTTAGTTSATSITTSAIPSSTSSSTSSPAPVSTTTETTTTTAAGTTTLTTTTTTSNGVGPISQTTTTTVSSWSFFPNISTTTTTWSFSVGPISGSTTTTVSPVSTGSATWLDWVDSTTTTSTPVTYSTTTAAADSTWLDWPETSSTTTTTSSSVDPTWLDWTASTTTTTTSSPAKKPTTTTSLPATWADWDPVTITLTQTWIEPCATGYVTKTTTLVTTHCGCTETPVPTIPGKTITITPSSGWPVKTPVVVTVPAGSTSAVPAKPKPSEPAGSMVTVTGPAAETGAAAGWGNGGGGGAPPSPSATVAVTLTVEAVPSGPTPVAPAGHTTGGVWSPESSTTQTMPWVATYTGAAGRSSVVNSAFGVLAIAGAAGLAMVA
ncbi:hypothetical protein PV08_04692 [Exophiala spinifera]|uniref:GH16 domain-containing protein n=1 Tax=Exophiala spinifera TaxID=91928 RepID=A0A0D2BEX9_9EURO|nr:uncharacterized protein PV08_04692 [Exophiala spinifera]KIW17498.1 hypothetical protein PV08_04692 [Exophiala spinifera]